MDNTFPNSVTRHGTNSGWRKHQTLGEAPCDACRSAKTEYDKSRLEEPSAKARNRAHAVAQGRAYTRLAAKYREDYQHLYQEAKEEVFEERGLEQ